MSATTSAATGRCFGIQRVCQVWERSRSALYARRARSHHHRLGGGAGAEAIGRAAAGGDSDRSRAVPVPRRRPSQGPRTASDPGRDPSRPHAGAARHAGARTALPAPRGVRTNGVAERWSGGIVRSRSKRSTAESFRTSRPSAPPWPTSCSGTTRPGVSRSLGITRRSRRARSMSYARRHSTNVCPGNRVRYKALPTLIPQGLLKLPRAPAFHTISSQPLQSLQLSHVRVVSSHTDPKSENTSIAREKLNSAPLFASYTSFHISVS